MKDVYQSACLVLAWLGQKENDSDRAVQCLEWLYVFVIENIPEKKMHKPLHLSHLSEYARFLSTTALKSLDFGKGASHQIPFNALIALFRRPWWRRLWVIQEFALAKDLLFLCGSDVLPLAWIRSAVTACYAYLPLAKDVEETDLIRKIIFYMIRSDSLISCNRSSGLQRLMQAVRISGRECSDPRDYVFGLFGLLDNAVIQQLGVDYTNSTVEIFTSVAELLLNYIGLELLLYASPLLRLLKDSKRTEGLLSWVPDWQQPCIKVT